MGERLATRKSLEECPSSSFHSLLLSRSTPRPRFHPGRGNSLGAHASAARTCLWFGEATPRSRLTAAPSLAQTAQRCRRRHVQDGQLASSCSGPTKAELGAVRCPCIGSVVCAARPLPPAVRPLPSATFARIHQRRSLAIASARTSFQRRCGGIPSSSHAWYSISVVTSRDPCLLKIGTVPSLMRRRSVSML